MAIVTAASIGRIAAECCPVKPRTSAKAVSGAFIDTARNPTDPASAESSRSICDSVPSPGTTTSGTHPVCGSRRTSSASRSPASAPIDSPGVSVPPKAPARSVSSTTTVLPTRSAAHSASVVPS